MFSVLATIVGLATLGGVLCTSIAFVWVLLREEDS